MSRDENMQDNITSDNIGNQQYFMSVCFNIINEKNDNNLIKPTSKSNYTFNLTLPCFILLNIILSILNNHNTIHKI